MERYQSHRYNQETLFEDEDIAEGKDYFSEEALDKIGRAYDRAAISGLIATFSLTPILILRPGYENLTEETRKTFESVVNGGITLAIISGSVAIYYAVQTRNLMKQYETKQLDAGLAKGTKGKFTQLIKVK